MPGKKKIARLTKKVKKARAKSDPMPSYNNLKRTKKAQAKLRKATLKKKK